MLRTAFNLSSKYCVEMSSCVGNWFIAFWKNTLSGEVTMFLGKWKLFAFNVNTTALAPGHPSTQMRMRAHTCMHTDTHAHAHTKDKMPRRETVVVLMPYACYSITMWFLFKVLYARNRPTNYQMLDCSWRKPIRIMMTYSTTKHILSQQYNKH